VARHNDYAGYRRPSLSRAFAVVNRQLMVALRVLRCRSQAAIFRRSIQVEDILHVRDKLRADGGDAPFLPQLGLEVIFFQRVTDRLVRNGVKAASR
jgi:hypothetical protein